MQNGYVSHETVLSQISVVDNRQAQNIQAAIAKLQEAQTAKSNQYQQAQQTQPSQSQDKSLVSKG